MPARAHSERVLPPSPPRDVNTIFGVPIDLLRLCRHTCDMERLAGVTVRGDMDGNNRLLRKYVHGPAVDQPICMIDANETCYYHYDGLGSVIALSDAAGEAAVLYEYSIYGQVAASDPNHPNPFLFTGREFDKETGLYYYRARYYNATIGRVLQTDPIGYGDGMNMYAYCGNNPGIYSDPWGLEHDPYNLPWNRGPAINVQVAFYDGGDPGRYDSNGVLVVANKDLFKEAADDFVYVKDGLTYYLYFDMNVKDPDEFIAETLASIATRGYKVTDIYFFDHCGTDQNGDFGLEFGSETWGAVKLQAFARWINFRYPKALPADCTINFRNCLLASEANRNGLFKNLASWFNRNVTGCSGTVDYTGLAKYDASAPEVDGPEYKFHGDLWMAKPGGQMEIIWAQMVPSLIEGRSPRNNPVPQPY
jgi:RHS repeat-associated protein